MKVAAFKLKKIGFHRWWTNSILLRIKQRPLYKVCSRSILSTWNPWKIPLGASGRPKSIRIYSGTLPICSRSCSCSASTLKSVCAENTKIDLNKNPKMHTLFETRKTLLYKNTENWDSYLCGAMAPNQLIKQKRQSGWKRVLYAVQVPVGQNRVHPGQENHRDGQDIAQLLRFPNVAIIGHFGLDFAKTVVQPCGSVFVINTLL